MSGVFYLNLKIVKFWFAKNWIIIEHRWFNDRLYDHRWTNGKYNKTFMSYKKSIENERYFDYIKGNK